MHLKDKNRLFDVFVDDAPMYGLDINWAGDKILRLDYWPAGSTELEEFFRSLAQ